MRISRAIDAWLYCFRMSLINNVIFLGMSIASSLSLDRFMTARGARENYEASHPPNPRH